LVDILKKTAQIEKAPEGKSESPGAFILDPSGKPIS
jgi:hypothetical protein